MYHNNVTFELLTSNGNPVTEYHHDSRTYIEGRKGSEYKIRIKNNGYSKVLVVPSVDGLSVMNGEPADYNSSGYILHGYETIVIDGWRTDLQSVRKFIFTRKSKSYSNKTGQGTNDLGVIGLAVFREKIAIRYSFTPQYNYQPHGMWHTTNVLYGMNLGSDLGDMGTKVESCSQNSSQTRSTTRSPKKGLTDEPMIAMASLTSTPVPTVGTGMGNKVDSKVITESFDREDRPYVTMQMFYYEIKQLEKMGVVQPRKVSEPQRPNPFPQEQHPMQFCKEV